MTSPESQPAPAKSRKKSKPSPAPSPSEGLAGESTNNLVVFANGVGVPPPPDAGNLPMLDQSLSISAIGRELGQLSRGTQLFLHRDKFVTVEPDGTLRLMIPLRFCSWVESVAYLHKTPREDRIDRWKMPAEEAAKILSSDTFREHVRPLRAVSEVRLPVWRGDGEQRTIELARPGYDEGTGVLCLDLVPFDETADPFEMTKWFLETHKHFPFASKGDLARHAFNMVSPFARLLLPRGEKMLGQLYNATQPRSGKSLLAVAALSPCFGELEPSPGATGETRNAGDELRKVLDTAAMEGDPYLWLDDVPPTLKNHALNGFMTSTKHKNRVMSQNATARNVNECIVVVTGNNVGVTSDLSGRFVVVDLLLDVAAQGRKFDQLLSPRWFYDHGNRGRLLSFLWALVRRWRDLKMPIDPDATKQGFQAHAALCGSIVRAVGLGSPFEERAATFGGDEETAATEELLHHAVSRCYPERQEWTCPQFLALAEEFGLHDAICGAAKSPNRVLGHKLVPFIGRKDLIDPKGRRFTIAKRDGSRGSIYVIRFPDE